MAHPSLSVQRLQKGMEERSTGQEGVLFAPSIQCCCFITGSSSDQTPTHDLSEMSVSCFNVCFTEPLIGRVDFPMKESRLISLRTFAAKEKTRVVVSLPVINITLTFVLIVYPSRVREPQHSHDTFNTPASHCWVLKIELYLDACQKGTLDFEAVVRACLHSCASTHLSGGLVNLDTRLNLTCLIKFVWEQLESTHFQLVALLNDMDPEEQFTFVVQCFWILMC